MVVYAKKQLESPLRLTREEYLERERKAETKSEYHGGIVVAMAGASWEHNVIVFDTIGTLSPQLHGKPCQGLPSDIRVRVPACDKYYYPDVTVVCEPPQFEDGRRDTLLNPTLLIEVLSDSTQATDRDEKWQCYQTLESLQSYVLISQNKPLVEIYRRQADGWFYTAFTQLESVVPLDAIGCELKLAEVYARVPFPPHPNQEERGEHD